ncbi:nucleotidyltransferase family protein [[Limnothrix rosea] IAM M-220]|uniref:nucleotidyltransferase family protein n=1 Tax=[Limnothrix rosea] IAM M-220 TaxID=454133 RepID=UPI00095E8342|nr:nucleotidyltransferase domain-containing protein [[Limnothrix rosea] IAM M-220]OKH17628.1 nucleotidyltransferase [[Limnothrix rosea] IAM M-220]
MDEVAIAIPSEIISEFCQQWRVVELSLFGSVLRDDFHADSDIDVMVQFHPDARPKFTTLDEMQAELQGIFQRKIDLVTRSGIEASRNYLRRQEILSSAKVIYAKRSPVST